MTKSFKFLFFGILALLVSLACNFSADTGNNTNTNTNTNSGDSSNSNINNVPGGTSLTVINKSDRTICSVYVAPKDAAEWGDERLGTDVLDPGESHAIEATDGTFSVRANDCDGSLIAEDIEFEISGATTWEVEDRSISNILLPTGAAGTLTVVNNSSEDVCYLYVSPSGSTSWGNDWLGEGKILGTGDQQTVTVGSGQYDLQAADCDANALAEQYEVDLSTGQTWTLNN